MNVSHLIQTDFVLLEADWPADQSRQLIDQVRPSHVIVHRREAERDYYYLYSRKEALDLLPLGKSVRAAFDLHESAATPLLDHLTPIDALPARAVVLEDGRLVGYFDRDQVTFGGATGARATRSVEQASERQEAIDAESVQRSLVAELPETIPVNETVSLLVSLSAVPPTGTESLPLTVAIGSIIDIVVQPRSGVTIEGPSEGRLTVASAAETPPIQFKLRGNAIGPAQVRVLAFHQGQPLGMMTLSALVKEGAAAATTARAPSEQPLAPVSVRLPDLSLVIFENREGDETVLTMRLTAANPAENLNFKSFGPVRLKTDPARYFGELFTDIEALPVSTKAERETAQAMVAAKGAHLFRSVFPADLQAELWRLRDRVTSVQIQSEEPWIPWEICRLLGKDGDRVVEGPFLCEAFAITRWLMGVGRRLDLTLGKMAIVVPGDSELPFAQDERSYMLSLATGGRAVTEVPATFLDVTRELASGQYDSWHFSGHGAVRSEDPNRSAIYLANEAAFTPEALSGVATNLGLARPLVFLNACQVGRSGMSLTDIGGWARQFLNAGAAGFVGAYWSVYDRPAFDFAKALYGRLLTGMPIGQAAKEARVAIKSTGDPTWLAYTVFADPWAALTTTASSTPDPG
jgi:hypothetical protein